MSIEEAFLEGLRLVRADLAKGGLDLSGGDIAVIAAHNVFHKRSQRVQFDPRFPTDGPTYAAKLIAIALTR